MPGGKAMFLEKVIRQMEEAEQAEAREKWKGIYMAEAKRSGVIAVLEARFGTVPNEVTDTINALADVMQLDRLHRFAVTCPDLGAFAAGLSSDLTLETWNP